MCTFAQNLTYQAMKNLFIFLFIAIVAVSCSSKQAATEKATEAVAVANKTVNLAVEGMTCTGCENTIKEAVGKVAGVTDVTASHTEGLAVVKYDSTKTDIKGISDAIIEAGYTVKGEKAPVSTPPSAN
jgi:copper chaperone CopZ